MRLSPTSEIKNKRKAGQTFSEGESNPDLPLVARDKVAAEKLNGFCIYTQNCSQTFLLYNYTVFPRK